MAEQRAFVTAIGGISAKEAAWQAAHGCARPQHGKRSQRYECR